MTLGPVTGGLLWVALGVFVVLKREYFVEWQDHHYGGLPDWWLVSQRGAIVAAGAGMVIIGVSKLIAAV